MQGARTQLQVLPSAVEASRSSSASARKPDIVALYQEPCCSCRTTCDPSTGFTRVTLRDSVGDRLRGTTHVHLPYGQAHKSSTTRCLPHPTGVSCGRQPGCYSLQSRFETAGLWTTKRDFSGGREMKSFCDNLTRVQGKASPLLVFVPFPCFICFICFIICLLLPFRRLFR